MADKRVYAFGKDQNGKNITEGNTDMKWVLGGKGAKVRAYVFSGEYAFVDVENGPVGWCKSARLFDAFSQEFSCINLWNYKASLGKK